MRKNKFEEAITSLTSSLELSDKYSDNKIGLYRYQVEELYSTIHRQRKEFRKSCEHEHCILHEGTNIDSGYGVDRHIDGYSLYCNDCRKSFISEINYGERIIDKGSLSYMKEKYDFVRKELQNEYK